MKVAKCNNVSVGSILVTIKYCTIGSHNYSQDIAFKVTDRPLSEPVNTRIKTLTRDSQSEWIDLTQDERTNKYRLRCLYKNEEKLWITE